MSAKDIRLRFSTATLRSRDWRRMNGKRFFASASQLGRIVAESRRDQNREIDDAVLGRASVPLPSPLGTLDAIHLATGLLWRETRDRELVMATHDAALGVAARACGLAVVGI